MFIEVIGFIQFLSYLYTRPFPRLGTLISFFARDIFTTTNIDIWHGMNAIASELTEDIFTQKQAQVGCI